MRWQTMAAAATTAAVLTIGAVGCSSTSNSSSTTTTTEKKAETTTTASKTGFEVQTDEGQVSLNIDGKLPPGWPSDFPTPKGASPAGSGSLGGTSKTVLVGVYDYDGAGSDAYDFYANNTDLTVTSKKSVGGANNFVGNVKLGGSTPGGVTVTAIGGTTRIVVVLEGAGAGGSSGTTPGTTKTSGSTPGTAVG